MYSVRKNHAGNCAAYSSTTTMLAARSCPTRKIDSGTSGACATRASTYTNELSSTTAVAIGTSTPVEPQPSVSVRTIPKVRATSPAVTSTAPATSKWRGPSSLLPAGITRSATAITIAPSATLMAKIAGQPNPCVSNPPSSAPDDAPSPPTAPHAPRPRLRSGPSGSDAVMIDSVAGETTAPANPCSARAPINRPRDDASAQSNEANANRPVPAMNTRRRPSRSAERPPSIRKPANVSVYAFTTHCRPVVEKCRPLWIAGSATLTIETSRMTMNCARQTTNSSAVVEFER